MPCPQSSKIAFSESSSFCKATSQCMWFLLNLEFPHLVPFISPACFLITSIYNSCFSSVLALWQSLSGCPPSPPPLALCSTPRHWFPSFLYNPLHYLLLIVMGTSIPPLHLWAPETAPGSFLYPRALLCSSIWSLPTEVCATIPNEFSRHLARQVFKKKRKGGS